MAAPATDGRCFFDNEYTQSHIGQRNIISMLTGTTVALVLIPQSLAYADLAGLEPVHGLYAAAAAPIAGAALPSRRGVASCP